jgi:hypothetical protein
MGVRPLSRVELMLWVRGVTMSVGSRGRLRRYAFLNEELVFLFFFLICPFRLCQLHFLVTMYFFLLPQ